MQDNIVTYVYLPTEVRNRLEKYAQERGVSLSETARRFIIEGLHRDTIDNTTWIRTALATLLRYHPRGDLEITVNEAIRRANELRNG